MARILVVDDEPAILTLMRFILEKSGHDIEEAVNGLEALGKLGVEPVDDSVPLPDLVVLDLMMPIMDGHKAFLRLRAHPRTEKLPIVVVTAKGDMRALFDQMPSVAGF